MSSCTQGFQKCSPHSCRRWLPAYYATPGVVSAKKCIPSTAGKPDTKLAFWGKIRGILVVSRVARIHGKPRASPRYQRGTGTIVSGSGGSVGAMPLAAQALRWSSYQDRALRLRPPCCCGCTDSHYNAYVQG